MSSHIPTALAREVRHRAKECCEYCLLPQSSQEATFHIDHIIPRAEGGATLSNNLALACVTCSLRKGARVLAIDPHTGSQERIFNPRLDVWKDVFLLTAGFRVDGITPTGRATIELLGMNRPAIVAIRKELNLLGRFPVAPLLDS